MTRSTRIQLAALALAVGAGCQMAKLVAGKANLHAAPPAPVAAAPPPVTKAAAAPVAEAAAPSPTEEVDPSRPYRNVALKDRRRHSDACEKRFPPLGSKDKLHADKMVDNVTRWLVDCGDEPTLSNVAWTLDGIDSVGETSQVLRAGFALVCLRPEAYEIEQRGPLSVVERYMTCGHDVRALDPRKFEAELGKLELDPHLVAVARARFREVHALGEKLLAEWAKLGPEYKVFLVDAQDAAWKQWVALRDAHAQAFKEIHAVELAYHSGVKSKLADCREKLRGEIERYMAKIQPRTVAEAHAAANDFVGAPLFGMLGACDTAAGRYTLAVQELGLSADGRRRHGPRAAALAASEAALKKILEDQTRFPVREAPDWAEPAPDQGNGDYPRGSAAQALTSKTSFAWEPSTSTVVKTSASGEYVKVEFKVTKEKVAEQDCRETNKVARIHPDGRVEYQTECWYTGKVHTDEHQLVDVFIPKELAAGIAPGRDLKVAIDQYNKIGDSYVAYPLEVRDGKKVVAYHGFALAL